MRTKPAVRVPSLANEVLSTTHLSPVLLCRYGLMKWRRCVAIHQSQSDWSTVIDSSRPIGWEGAVNCAVSNPHHSWSHDGCGMRW